MEFGAVGLVGVEHRVDDAGQFVSDGGATAAFTPPDHACQVPCRKGRAPARVDTPKQTANAI